MKIMKGIGSSIVALLVYVIIPYISYSSLYDFLSQGNSILSKMPFHVNFISGITLFNIFSIGLFITVFAFLRVSSESRKWKVIFSVLQMEFVLGYIIYYYLYGWFSISVSGIGFFFSYSGIFIIFAVTTIAKFARIIVDALSIKATGSASII